MSKSSRRQSLYEVISSELLSQSIYHNGGGANSAQRSISPSPSPSISPSISPSPSPSLSPSISPSPSPSISPSISPSPSPPRLSVSPSLRLSVSPSLRLSVSPSLRLNGSTGQPSLPPARPPDRGITSLEDQL